MTDREKYALTALRPYVAPRLRVYGSVRDITLTAANNMAADGGAAGNMDKTS